MHLCSCHVFLSLFHSLFLSLSLSFSLSHCPPFLSVCRFLRSTGIIASSRCLFLHPVRKECACVRLNICHCCCLSIARPHTVSQRASMMGNCSSQFNCQCELIRFQHPCNEPSPSAPFTPPRIPPGESCTLELMGKNRMCGKTHQHTIVGLRARGGI